MKQIIPFKKELLLKTKISEVTSISLEHTLSLKEDHFISGEFRITGDYKMTEGSIQREEFNFNLPFEIALDDLYDVSSMIIDIDNFYYEIINNEAIKVNIDVYIEGKKLENKVVDVTDEVEVIEDINDNKHKSDVKIDFPDLSNFVKQEEKNDVKKEDELPEVPKIEGFFDKRENDIKLENNVDYSNIDKIEFFEKDDSKNNFNLFDGIDNSNTYVTYHVYVVKDNDTIEDIMKKYEVTKDEISIYNNIEEIKPGMKIIIPN